MLQQIFAIIAPVLAIAFIGFAWVRAGRPFDTKMVSDLVANVGAPCLLFSTLLANRPEPAVLGQMVVIAFVLFAAVGVVAALVLWAVRQPFRTYWPAIVFPNTGNMGLPLSLLAFGETGLALAVVYFAATAVLQFTVGMSAATGRMTVGGVARNPILWAIGIAAVFLWTGATPPKWIENTALVIAGFVIPLMLMSLGTSLARLKIATFSRSFAFAMLRLVAGFGCAVLFCELLGLEGPARGVAIIQSSMPTAVFNYLFAVQFDNRPEEVGSMVVISTVASFLLLPFLMAFVLSGPS